MKIIDDYDGCVGLVLTDEEYMLLKYSLAIVDIKSVLVRASFEDASKGHYLMIEMHDKFKDCSR
jgi:hypothetical protein